MLKPQTRRGAKLLEEGMTQGRGEALMGRVTPTTSKWSPTGRQPRTKRGKALFAQGAHSGHQRASQEKVTRQFWKEPTSLSTPGPAQVRPQWMRGTGTSAPPEPSW